MFIFLPGPQNICNNQCFLGKLIFRDKLLMPFFLLPQRHWMALKCHGYSHEPSQITPIAPVLRLSCILHNTLQFPTPCGAGLALAWCFSPSKNFYPPTPCGVGRELSSAWWKNTYFNPPTPCGVGPEYYGNITMEVIFQSTHPVWGGTMAHP